MLAEVMNGVTSNEQTSYEWRAVRIIVCDCRSFQTFSPSLIAEEVARRHLRY